jgi:hypothetical protein
VSSSLIARSVMNARKPARKAGLLRFHDVVGCPL